MLNLMSATSVKRLFFIKGQLKIHLKRSHVNRIHLKIKPLKKLICNECEASFEHKQRLEHHMNKVHLNVKPYGCNFCEKVFFLEKDLNTHLKRSHGEK